MKLSARHITQLFDISRESVRQYANEFGEYMSVTANPGQGRHRQFVEDDLTVFALIVQLKRQGMLYDDIHLALKNGQRGDVPDGVNSIVPSTRQPQAITLQQRIDTLESAVTTLRTERDKAIGQNELMERQLTEAQEQVIQLRIKLARLEASQDDSE